MSAKNKPLTKWKKFKMWASRSFGCTSGYTVKDSLPSNGETRGPSQERATKPKLDADVADGSKVRPNQKPTSQQQQKSTNPLSSSFSKDSEDIPYIDESMINIPQAVK